MSFVIKSDFEDFYDTEVDTGKVYERFYSKSMSRGEALRKLRLMNIPTIKLQSVNDINVYAENVVVYTDPYKHLCEGKKVLRLTEAKQMYGNYLASEYIKSDSIMKYLQIGERIFRLFYRKNIEEVSLRCGELYDIQEIGYKMFNPQIRLPIFSIDYIEKDRSIIAVDFNEVQRLEGLGIESFITKEEVLYEIEKAMSRV